MSLAVLFESLPVHTGETTGLRRLEQVLTLGPGAHWGIPGCTRDRGEGSGGARERVRGPRQLSATLLHTYL